MLADVCCLLLAACCLLYAADLTAAVCRVLLVTRSASHCPSSGRSCKKTGGKRGGPRQRQGGGRIRDGIGNEPIKAIVSGVPTDQQTFEWKLIDFRVLP